MKSVKFSLNGLDLQKLSDTINQLYVQPELGSFKFKIINRWTGGTSNHSVTEDYHSAGQESTERKFPFIQSNDMPSLLLGNDSAPSPVENLLHAIAGCFTTTMVYHATIRGSRISKIKTHIEADVDLRGFLGLDSVTKSGFKELCIRVELDGDLTDEEKNEIIQAGSSSSPIFEMITYGIPVRLTLDKKIINDPEIQKTHSLITNNN